MFRTLLTPTLWGTVLGIILAYCGHPTAGGVFLAVVGWGGVGIALRIGVEEDRDPWRFDTAAEAILNSLRGKRIRTLVGLLTHLPQGIAGLILLAIGGY